MGKGKGGFNPQHFLNEYYPDYNPGLWLTMCSIFGGSFGVFAGGFLSDLAVKRMGLHSRYDSTVSRG